MADETADATPVRRPPGPWKLAWRRLRSPIAQSGLFRWAVAAVVDRSLGFVRWTSPSVADSHDIFERAGHLQPAIVAMWHGQHLLTPYFYPKGYPLAAMFSRSRDAEINARVFERRGFQTVRGSGGREGRQSVEKGGARALIGLKRHLDAGTNVAMIADITHGEARRAGLGIVTLARISGRPIVPIATVTSRRRVIESSWDRTTIHLPFGRSALVVGEIVEVPSDADEALMAAKRAELTRSLDAAYAEAYRLVDGDGQ